jgi:hypothetical protein
VYLYLKRKILIKAILRYCAVVGKTSEGVIIYKSLILYICSTYIYIDQILASMLER